MISKSGGGGGRQMDSARGDCCAADSDWMTAAAFALTAVEGSIGKRCCCSRES